MFVRLTPEDRLLPEVKGGRFREPLPAGYLALKEARLMKAYSTAPAIAGPVGEWLLTVPSGYREIRDSEFDRLLEAHRAVTGEKWLGESGSIGASLVLLRGRVANFSPQDEFTLVLDAGQTLPVSHDCDHLPRSVWAVIEVTRNALVALGGPDFFYDLKLALPGSKSLTVSTIDPIVAKAVCFDAVRDFLLTAIDLSDCGLDDPPAALEFLRTAHRDSLPEGTIPNGWEDKRSFSRRLSDAMEKRADSRATLSGPPPKRLVKTFAEAEEAAAEFMRWLGYANASTTPVGVDGGIDVVASDAVAQVKMEGIPTGRDRVQALYGVAAVEQKVGLFFSLAGYTAPAVAWADRAGVALFEFAYDGTFEPVNRPARALAEEQTKR